MYVFSDLIVIYFIGTMYSFLATSELAFFPFYIYIFTFYILTILLYLEKKLNRKNMQYENKLRKNTRFGSQKGFFQKVNLKKGGLS